MNPSVVGAVQACNKKDFPLPEIASTHERTAAKCNNQMTGFKVEMRLLSSAYEAVVKAPPFPNYNDWFIGECLRDKKLLVINM